MPTSGRPTSRAIRTIPSFALSWSARPLLLDLEVDVVRPEDLQQVVDVRAGLGGVVVDEAAAEARLEAAGERDHALGVAFEQPHVDVGLAAPVPLEEAGRGELDEVAEALVVAGEQREVVALEPDRLVLHVVHQVGLEAEDRLDAVLAAGLVELDRAVHDPVVGEPQRRLAERGRPLGQRVDLAGAVEQRVLGVDVQVGDRRGRHGGASLGTRADGSGGLAEGASPLSEERRWGPGAQPV